MFWKKNLRIKFYYENNLIIFLYNYYNYFFLGVILQKLKIDDLIVYKLFSKLNYSLSTAIMQLIDNSVNSFEKNESFFRENNIKKTILINLCLDEKWIQIIDNAGGIELDTVADIYRVDKNNKSGCGLKSAAFWLGTCLTIESKPISLKTSFKTRLNLIKNGDGALIKFLEPNAILRSFKTGTRVTIDNIHHIITLGEINEIYNILSNYCRDYCKNIQIVFAVSQNKKIIDPSFKEPKYVDSITEITPLSYFNNLDSTKQLHVDYDFTFNNKTVRISGNIYFDKNLKKKGIIFFRQRPINIENPLFLNTTNNNYYGEVKISGLPINIEKKEFMMESPIKNIIANYLTKEINSMFIKSESEIDQNIINQTKEFLSNRKDPTFELNLNNHDTAPILFLNDDDYTEANTYITKALDNCEENGRFEDIQITKNELAFNYTADDGKLIKVNLNRCHNDKMNGQWLELVLLEEKDIEQEYHFLVNFNIEHPFFQPFYNDKETIYKLEHFVVCYAISETVCKLDGLSANSMKYEINKLLRTKPASGD